MESYLGRGLPPGPPIGESWEIVDRPEAQSIVRGGALEGTPLRKVIASAFLQMNSPDEAGPLLRSILDQGPDAEAAWLGLEDELSRLPIGQSAVRLLLAPLPE